MKKILVVGGAGYIGAHMCKHLAHRGYTPVVLDNFIYGHRDAVRWGPLIEGDLADQRLLAQVFKRYRFDAVMHFAAFCYVGESVLDPGRYYANNVAATLNLLQTMIDHGINNFIFSSTCATYGEPQALPLTEDHPQQPINPYGRSKLMVEQICDDFARAYGLRHISLRYFNAAGADPDGELGEDHRPETHLIPIVLQTALGQREKVAVFGHDYTTSDGTCIRDYIHIVDIAQAHLLALECLLNKGTGGCYNLGNQKGHSVIEVVETARRITGHPIPTVADARRKGDPAELVGSSAKIKRKLGWSPRYSDLETIIKSAWQWHRRHPHGFKQ
jgi:UDP-glucose-4-epimerase GalE